MKFEHVIIILLLIYIFRHFKVVHPQPVQANNGLLLSDPLLRRDIEERFEMLQKQINTGGIGGGGDGGPIA